MKILKPIFEIARTFKVKVICGEGELWKLWYDFD
jgi:hypothetical protein